MTTPEIDTDGVRERLATIQERRIAEMYEAAWDVERGVEELREQ